MNFFSDADGRLSFSYEGQAQGFFLSLGKDIVLSLSEVTLEEETVFILLLGLPHELKHLVLLLSIEKHSQGSSTAWRD